MRRWNGWGDETINYPLPDSSAAYLADLVGEGPRLENAALEPALASMGASRLPAHPGISTDEKDRLLHACGKSLPDWVALRSVTISHQHGMGFDHLRYPPEEKGALGMNMLKSVCRQLDPDGMMNPGKLLK